MFSRLAAAGVLCAAVSGCFGLPDLDPPAAMTEPATPRAAAVAEMRAEAAAGDKMPYPDAFQADQTQRLAAREEPLSVADVGCDPGGARAHRRSPGEDDQRARNRLARGACPGASPAVLRSGGEPVLR